MTSIFRLAPVAALALFALSGRGADSWPQFRGPDGDGTTSARRLPLQWSEDDNVRWKTPIHGRAWSSPVIWGRQVWLTTATEDGRELSAVCVDRDTGKIVHDLLLFRVEKPQFAHKFNSYASPTPVVESGRVYVTFGAPGTACLDTETGRVLWQRTDIACNHFRGAGSSPILWRDLLIMNYDGSDHQFVLALDRRTGKTVWRQNRSIDFKDLTPEGKPEADGDWRKAFSTPHIGSLDGRVTLVSIGAKATYGYDPKTGREWWRVEERTSHSASTRPVIQQNLVLYPSGWSSGQVIALRPGRKGGVLDVNAAGTPTNAGGGITLAWKSKRNVPKKPSLQPAGPLLLMIDDGGIVSCLETATGQEVWRERVGGNYSASPLLAGDRLYVFSEEGKATVLSAGRTFHALATNSLGDGFMASPAVAGQALYLRTRTHLYRIEDSGLPHTSKNSSK